MIFQEHVLPFVQKFVLRNVLPSLQDLLNFDITSEEYLALRPSYEQMLVKSSVQNLKRGIQWYILPNKDLELENELFGFQVPKKLFQDFLKFLWRFMEECKEISWSQRDNLYPYTEPETKKLTFRRHDPTKWSSLFFQEFFEAILETIFSPFVSSFSLHLHACYDTVILLDLMDKNPAQASLSSSSFQGVSLIEEAFRQRIWLRKNSTFDVLNAVAGAQPWSILECKNTTTSGVAGLGLGLQTQQEIDVRATQLAQFMLFTHDCELILGRAKQIYKIKKKIEETSMQNMQNCVVPKNYDVRKNCYYYMYHIDQNLNYSWSRHGMDKRNHDGRKLQDDSQTQVFRFLGF